MVKVRIVGPVDEELREALMKLLGEAGCEVSEDLPTDADEVDAEHLLDDEAEECEETEEEEEKEEPGEDGAEPPSGFDDEVGVVVLSPKCLADGSLEKAMEGAASRGCHVVGVWPPGTEIQDLPQAFEDYGGDTVIWDPARLRDIVLRPAARPKWPTPDDQPRAERPLKRNKC